jgi:hypothetical protein
MQADVTGDSFTITTSATNVEFNDAANVADVAGTEVANVPGAAEVSTITVV